MSSPIIAAHADSQGVTLYYQDGTQLNTPYHTARNNKPKKDQSNDNDTNSGGRARRGNSIMRSTRLNRHRITWEEEGA